MRPYYVSKNGYSKLWQRIGFSPEAIDIVLTCVVANTAFIAAFIGFALTARTVKGKIPTATPYHVEIGKPHLFTPLLFIFIALGIYANFRIFYGAGLESVLAIETQMDGMAGQQLKGISGYTTAMAEFLPSILLLLVTVPKLRKLAFMLIAAYVFIRLLAGAQRLSFIVVILGVSFYFLVAARRRYPSFKVVLLVFVFAFLFNIIGGDRYAMRRLVMGTATIGEVVSDYFDNRGGEGLTNDTVEFDVAAATLSAVTTHNDYTYGTQYLRILIWPIPRQIWPSKPVYTSIVNLNDYGDFRYLTTGVYADTFMAFSFISLIVMMALLGVFFSKVYELLLRSNNVACVMFFWIVFIFSKTILRDGGVTVFYFWIFSMFPIVILTYLGKLKLCRDTHQST